LELVCARHGDTVCDRLVIETSVFVHFVNTGELAAGLRLFRADTMGMLRQM